MKSLMHWFWGLQKRLYRGWVLLFALAFIELDIRKVITLELPAAAETQAIQAILDVFKEHFFVHFLLLGLKSLRAAGPDRHPPLGQPRSGRCVPGTRMR